MSLALRIPLVNWKFFLSYSGKQTHLGEFVFTVKTQEELWIEFSQTDAIIFYRKMFFWKKKKIIKFATDQFSINNNNYLDENLEKPSRTLEFM
jgi:hypothetical protein